MQRTKWLFLGILLVCLNLQAQEPCVINPLLQKHLQENYFTAPTLDLFVEISPQNIPLLSRYEATLSLRKGKLALISIPPHQIRALAQSGIISRIEYTAQLPSVLNDSMRVNNHVNEIHSGQAPLPSSYTGKDVIVGVIDAGIDIRHPDFIDSTGNTRTLYLWDQITGIKWDSTQINAGACTHKSQGNQFGHGSQVTGIAAGNGLATGNYKGVAPDADLIIVNSNFNAPNWLGTVANAVKYIFDKADSLGKPCVINASIGDYIGSHDGLDAASLLIDSMLKAKKGRAMAAACGNAGGIPYHLGYNVTSDTSWSWFKYNSASQMVYFELWADTNDFNQVQFAFGADKVTPSYHFRGKTNFKNIISNLNQTLTDSIVVNGNTLAVIQTYAEESQGRYYLQVMMNQPDSSAYNYRFMTTGSGRFDVWAPYWGGVSQVVKSPLPTTSQLPDIVFYKPPDSLKTLVSSFQCLPSVLTVGNYINVKAYVDIDSNTQVLPDVKGSLAASSSIGPDRKNRLKPDLCATGHNTMSSTDSSIIAAALGASQNNKIGLGGFHKINGGTSMASPVVAGLVALYLEKCPNADYLEIKNNITATAFADTFTKTVPNNTWGNGKLHGFNFLTQSNHSFNILPGNDISICKGDSVTLLTPNGLNTFNWSNGITANSFVTDTNGTYFLSARNTSGCLGFSDTAKVSILLLPVRPFITQSNDTLYSSPAYSYQWYNNSSALPGETNQYLKVLVTGNYFVAIADSNQCRNYSDTLNVIINGMESLHSRNTTIKVYPNPSSGQLNISGAEAGTAIILYDILGNRLISTRSQKDITSLSVPFAPGNYFLKVGNEVVRIVISE